MADDKRSALGKKIGIRVEKSDESDRNKKVWRILRSWLGEFIFAESGTHVIRYALPKKTKGGSCNGAEQQVPEYAEAI